jgi:hypothetical protein
VLLVVSPSSATGVANEGNVVGIGGPPHVVHEYAV